MTFLCFVLLSFHFQVKPTHSLHATIDNLKLSRHHDHDAYEDYVWVSLGNAMKAKQSKAKHTLCLAPWEVAATMRWTPQMTFKLCYCTVTVTVTAGVLSK
jgi:hypothetical protein